MGTCIIIRFDLFVIMLYVRCFAVLPGLLAVDVSRYLGGARACS